MTPFLAFCLQFPDALHFNSPRNQFWCGDLEPDLCEVCPNKDRANPYCNDFTPAELAYVQTNLPELLV